MSKLEPCTTCANRSLCGHEEMACMAFVGFVCRGEYYEKDKQNPNAWNYMMIYNKSAEVTMNWLYNEHMNKKRKEANV